MIEIYKNAPEIYEALVLLSKLKTPHDLSKKVFSLRKLVVVELEYYQEEHDKLINTHGVDVDGEIMVRPGLPGWNAYYQAKKDLDKKTFNISDDLLIEEQELDRLFSKNTPEGLAHVKFSLHGLLKEKTNENG